MIRLNHGGDGQQNPLISGLRFRAFIYLDPSETVYKCWTSSGGSITADKTQDIQQLSGGSVVVNFDTSVDSVSGDEAVENFIHFTTNKGKILRSLWVANLPKNAITLDGYSGDHPTRPLTVHFCG